MSQGLCKRAGSLILLGALALGAILLAACANPSQTPTPAPTPTVDPAIYNQVPETHVFEPGECAAILNAPTNAYTSNTLGGAPSGEIPAGQYQVDVVATYATSQWYALHGVGTANYVNGNDISSLQGNCETTK